MVRELSGVQVGAKMISNILKSSVVDRWRLFHPQRALICLKYLSDGVFRICQKRCIAWIESVAFSVRQSHIERLQWLF